MAILRINAGPGCGKSHTLINLFMYIRANNRTSWERSATQEQMAIYEWCRLNLPEACKAKCGYFAYNDEIVQDMKRKSHPETKCLTAHGWGYSVLNKEFGFLKINSARSLNIVQKATGKSINDMDNKEKYRWLSTNRHLEKIKEELLEPNLDNLNMVHNKYDSLAPFQVFPEMPDYIRKVLSLHKTPDYKMGIEYVDQVWLALFALKSPIYPLGLIDEDQDLSPARLQLALRLFENLIFCGDENQAVNAFNGADPDSVDKIRKHVNLELPLKESFRCPPNICTYLNNMIPTAALRPSPEKLAGVESRMSLSEFSEHVKKLNTTDHVGEVDEEYFTKYGINKGNNEWGDSLVVCRYNAPLVKVCIKLIEQKIPCYILGNTLIDDLCRLVEQRKASTLEELDNKLNIWLSACRGVNEYIYAQLQDKVECIRLVMEYCEYPEDVPRILKTFLKPKQSEGLIRLSTIHRAKGLEAKHLFILFPPVEHPKAKTPTEKKQERNLHFVAVSRTKRNLTWVVNNDS